MSHVQIFDTTLRDGEQSPGFSMNTPEKIRMAHQLAALGVDVIEAGFPIASKGDLEAVMAVANEVQEVPIAALARARKDDIMAAVEALKPAKYPRMHVFLATSDLHLQAKLHMTRQQALEAISSMIKLAKNFVAEVEFSAEDAGRTELEFLCEACQIAIDNGATVLNLPDTVGYAVPEEYGAMFRKVREHLGDPDHIVLSAHCHDDLGLAVANSLAAVRVVGANAFAHEAGIHQDGIIKNPLTYEIISPEAVGVPSRSLVLGKHSGRHALRQTLEDLGYSPSDAELAECYRRMTTFADQTKQVRARDIMAIAHQVIHRKNVPVATGTSSLA
jgi:isopropylmalate/homocitrate/citramalate synthase